MKTLAPNPETAKTMHKSLIRRVAILVGTSACVANMQIAFGQSGSPVPGGGGQSAAPMPGGTTGASWAGSTAQPRRAAAPPQAGSATPGGFGSPAPGAFVQDQPVSQSRYRQLPLTVNDAKLRLEELRNLLAISRPQEIQDSVFTLCEWLQEMADAHWKMSVSFGKNDSTKLQSQQERQTAVKVSQLKHQAMLLKADVLIKQKRFPEALSPLVDIVVAEPRTTTGQSAYQRLQELGFSEEITQPLFTADDAASLPNVAPTQRPVAAIVQPAKKH